MHKRMFLTQLESTLWRRGGAELFLARTQLTKPQSIHQPRHPTNPLAVPLACIHWTHFHPPFAGCLSTAIWTKMMSHSSSRIFRLTFPHPITFLTLDRHILLRARAPHPGVLRLNTRTQHSWHSALCQMDLFQSFTEKSQLTKWPDGVFKEKHTNKVS